MHYMKKHAELCWLSIDYSLVRILEQMENLREYFLKEIPKQKGFNQKNGLVNNGRYRRIASVLKDPKAEIYMSFVVLISQSFNRFLKPLQTSSPVIHRLYPVCLQLVHELLDKVIKESLLKKEGKSVLLKSSKKSSFRMKKVKRYFILHLNPLHLLNLK